MFCTYEYKQKLSQGLGKRVKLVFAQPPKATQKNQTIFGQDHPLLITPPKKVQTLPNDPKKKAFRLRVGKKLQDFSKNYQSAAGVKSKMRSNNLFPRDARNSMILTPIKRKTHITMSSFLDDSAKLQEPAKITDNFGHVSSQSPKEEISSSQELDSNRDQQICNN